MQYIMERTNSRKKTIKHTNHPQDRAKSVRNSAKAADVYRLKPYDTHSPLTYRHQNVNLPPWTEANFIYRLLAGE